MSPKVVEHSPKEEAVMQQLIHQLGPKTRLAKLTMVNWKAENAYRSTSLASAAATIASASCDSR